MAAEARGVSDHLIQLICKRASAGLCCCWLMHAHCGPTRDQVSFVSVRACVHEQACMSMSVSVRARACVLCLCATGVCVYQSVSVSLRLRLCVCVCG